MDLNKVMLIGNVTQDPELRNLPTGSTVTTFSVATNLNWTDGNGVKQSKAEFHNIVAWKKLAEICAQYLKKGKKVYLEGRLQTRDWVDQQGVKHWKTEIVADNMIMLDRGGESGGSFGGVQQNTGSRSNESSVFDAPPLSGASPSREADDADSVIKVEDIPF